MVARGPELPEQPTHPEQPGSLVVTLRDITDRKRAELGWVEAALMDPLTRLPNRRGVDQQLSDVILAAAPRSVRLGGDEFVVVCHRAPTDGLLDEIGTRLLHAVTPPVTVDGREHRVGLSIGIAVGDCPPGSLHALLREADAALYGVKRTGRGRAAWAHLPAAPGPVAGPT